MAYLEVHQSLRDHRKVLALAAELDMPEAHVAGHCVFLWLWSLDNAEDGILPRSERIIARAAGWQGDPGVFVAALISAGMLERNADDQILIHDWKDYTGRLIAKWKFDVERWNPAYRELRRQVIARDGLNCGLCGRSVRSDDVDIDHIIPKSMGGPTEIDNLRVTHSHCNRSRGNRAWLG